MLEFCADRIHLKQNESLLMTVVIQDRIVGLYVSYFLITNILQSVLSMGKPSHWDSGLEKYSN